VRDKLNSAGMAVQACCRSFASTLSSLLRFADQLETINQSIRHAHDGAGRAGWIDQRFFFPSL